MKPAPRTLIAGSIALIAAASMLQSARADLKIVQKTIIDAPGVKQTLLEIPDQQRAPLLKMMSPMLTGEPWMTTTYLKGPKMRTDMGGTAIIINSATGHEVTLNRLTKQYSIGPYDPFQKAAGTFDFHLTPTGKTGTMLGHLIQQYSITLSSSVLPKSDISGDLWAAPDLPTPPMPGYDGGIAAGFESQMAQVKGMPLAYRLVYRNTPEGDITVTSYATSILTSDLPPSDFLIPADYSKGVVQHETTTPSAGYPLGDGVPLDNLDAVTNDMIGGDGSASAGGSAGDQSALGNISPEMLQGLMGGMTGGQSTGSAGALGGLGSMINPQMLSQLSAEMKSLMSGDGN